MNEVFESYVRAVLGAHFRTAVEEQKFVGNLLAVHPGGVSQRADYFWRDRSGPWIGDAKYKHLAKGQRGAPRFSDLDNKENGPEVATTLAGQVLSASDIRQLTVYAELVRSREQMTSPPSLMLLYPFVGSPDEGVPDKVTAWNGSTFWLMPVRVKRRDFIGDAIRFSGSLTQESSLVPA
jgi:hypothetical protein